MAEPRGSVTPGTVPTGGADLHVHTTASDGTLSPSRTVSRAAALGFRAVGICDHDTLGGLEEALEAGEGAGIELVPGVEINTDHGGLEIHILGYYIDRRNEGFLSLLEELRSAREGRADRMIDRLTKVAINLDPARVRELAGDAAIGRPHLARVMVERGYVTTVREAFDRYLSPGRPGYVERFKLGPIDAVKEILKAGGVPVLAHPGLIGRDDLIPQLVAAGLRGIEAYHPDHDSGQSNRYRALGEQMGLIVTGGSDCHGPQGNLHGSMGQVRMPYEVVESMKREIRSLRGSLA